MSENIEIHEARIPCLPQDDRSPTRALELSYMRSSYTWDHRDFAPYPSIALRDVERGSVRYMADVFIGALGSLPPREWPGLKYLFGRVMTAVVPGVELFDRLALRTWIALGLGLREILDDSLDGLVRELAKRVLELMGSQDGLPSEADFVALFADFALELSTELGNELDERLTRVNAKVALVNGVSDLAQGWFSSTGSARAGALLGALRQVLADTVLGTDRVEQTQARVLEAGLDPWVGTLAALTQTAARISSRAEELPPGPVNHDAVSHYMPKPRTPNPRIDDEVFARLAVAGPNPVVIERVRERLPAGFAVNDGHLREALVALGAPEAAVAELSLERAIAEGRLFLTDYALLEGIVCRDGPDLDVMGQVRLSVEGQRYLPAPYGLFYRSEAGLVPVAIQLGRDPQQYEVFTPAVEAELWSRVKMIYLCGDHNHQQMAIHVGGCHLFLIGVVMATARQLHPSHPLSKLLEHHTRWILFTGFFGRQLLLEKGGFIESAYSGELQAGSLEITRRYYQKFDYRELVFPSEVASRGVEEPASLPDYPFRDDGVALWKALHGFISAYLSVYYEGPEDLAADRELQGWLGELRSPRGAHVPGFPAQVESVAQLAEIVTALVFRASCLHAAVNYPQYDYYGHPDRAPASLMADPRDVRSLDDSAYWPGTNPALTQISMTYAAGVQRDKVLADYDFDWFEDARIWPLVVGLKLELAQIEADIDARAERVGQGYDYLRPSLVTVSANI